MAECCVVAEGFRSALRAPLHPSHCLPRPLRERPASGPLPLMCPRVDTPPATTQHIRQSENLEKRTKTLKIALEKRTRYDNELVGWDTPVRELNAN
jgi:hypothetical protein